MRLNGAKSIVLREDLETFEIRFGTAPPELMAGVAAKIFVAGANCHIPQPDGEGWVVRFDIPRSHDLAVVLGKLKKLFQPRLAVSYAYFGVKVTVCENHEHSAIVEEWRYLTQFEPENPKAFEAALAARLRQVDLADFAEPGDPATQEELEAKLAQIITTTINLAGAAIGWVDVQFGFCCRRVGS